MVGISLEKAAEHSRLAGTVSERHSSKKRRTDAQDYVGLLRRRLTSKESVRLNALPNNTNPITPSQMNHRSLDRTRAGDRAFAALVYKLEAWNI